MIGSTNVRKTGSGSQAKDLSMYNIYGQSIAQTTANCYVINTPGTYKLPLVFGNAIKDGSVNSAAYTNNGAANCMDFVDYKGNIITSPYIETVSGSAYSATISIADSENAVIGPQIIEDIPCRYLQFSVSHIPAIGANAVISITDIEGVVMWSWHIWVWPDDLTPVEITNATNVKYNILPVNLASIWDDDTKMGIRNWFYQWGRPTPLIGVKAGYSATDMDYYGSYPFSKITAAANFQEGIKNPTTFYFGVYSTYTWFGTSIYYNLWDANCSTIGASDNDTVKTVYDPCPIGFKVPNGNVFSGFSNANRLTNANNGAYFKRNSTDSIGVFVPFSGWRNSSVGSLQYVKSNGYMWTSASSSSKAAIYWTGSSSNATVSNHRTSNGCPVRPVQE